MKLRLQHSKIHRKSALRITGSKSETNRILLLQALFPNISIENVSSSDDSNVMEYALRTSEKIIDVHHAGTAMRFLTAFFATQNREVILTGSERMKERPIKILVDALRQMGVTINYEEKEGFPPIKIMGKKIDIAEVSLPANVSSQYISALMLIAPSLENGLKIILEGEITSIPYIKMTLGLLNEIGVSTSFEGNVITVQPLKNTFEKKIITVESDWSSASYIYSIIALSEIGTEISLSSFRKNSLQGDSILAEIYQNFGVKTIFQNNFSITLIKEKEPIVSSLQIYLNNAPDIAQTIAVTCFGLGIACELTGLHTLKIKETDRLEALQTELKKLGAKISVTDRSLSLKQSSEIISNIEINTYNDHRMAMAFAPLALKIPLKINEAEVVSKSFPTFWDDLKLFGFSIETIQE